MQRLIKEALVKMKQMTSHSFGVKYAWKDKKIEEPFLKAVLEVSFECLEHQTKA